jgi:ATP-dependent Lon protease
MLPLASFRLKIPHGQYQGEMEMPRFNGPRLGTVSNPGVARTPVGGDALFIEAGRLTGGDKGPVIQESVQAALTWVRRSSTHIKGSSYIAGGKGLAR